MKKIIPDFDVPDEKLLKIFSEGGTGERTSVNEIIDRIRNKRGGTSKNKPIKQKKKKEERMKRRKGKHVSLGELSASEQGFIGSYDSKKVSDIEFANFCKVIKDKYGISNKNIAEFFGKPAYFVEHRVAILKLPKEVLDMIKDGSLKFYKAFNKLVPLKSPEKQIEEAKNIIEGKGTTKRSGDKGDVRRKKKRRKEVTEVSSGSFVDRFKKLTEEFGEYKEKVKEAAILLCEAAELPDMMLKSARDSLSASTMKGITKFVKGE